MSTVQHQLYRYNVNQYSPRPAYHGYQPTSMPVSTPRLTHPVPQTMFPVPSTPPPTAVKTQQNSGYSVIPVDLAEKLVSVLKMGEAFSQHRKDYVQKQIESRKNGKADVVNLEECLEVAGEKSKHFESIVRKLGIFSKDSHNQEVFVQYKKVPRTALQQKTKQPDNEEDLLRYLFSRWMQVDSGSVFMKPVTPPGKHSRELKVWRSYRYINQYGCFCEAFVISSEFNRHLFRKELLD